MKTAKCTNLAVALIALSTVVVWATVGFGRAADSPAASSDSRSGLMKLEGMYHGIWGTTKNQKLSGAMNCEVRPIGRDHWRGRFFGQWQQVPFDYTVEFRADHAARSTRLVAAERGARSEERRVGIECRCG